MKIIALVQVNKLRGLGAKMEAVKLQLKGEALRGTLGLWAQSFQSVDMPIGKCLYEDF